MELLPDETKVSFPLITGESMALTVTTVPFTSTVTNRPLSHRFEPGSVDDQCPALKLEFMRALRSKGAKLVRRYHRH